MSIAVSQQISLFLSQIESRRFNEANIRVLESFLASNDFKSLDGVARALKQFMRKESLCIIQEIAGKSTEHKLLIVDFLVRVFALIGDTESCLALRYEALLMREQKATSDQGLLVSYSEWLTFAEHSLENGFCSIAKKACEKALLCFEMNIVIDPGKDDFVIEKIKKLKDIAVISASSRSVSSLEWHSNQNHSFQDLKTKDLYTTKDVLVQTWLPMPLRRMMSVNSVNGFVCFWSTTEHSRFHIFNPVTKEHVTTPTNTYLGKNMNDDPSAVGLGICPLWYEYKVVVLDNAEFGVIKPSIFTIGKDYLWRSLKDIPYHTLAQVQTVAYVKGVLYWYTKTCTSAHYLTTYQIKTTKTLICFDVTKEEFDMIVVPFESLKEQVISIAEKGGTLCLVIISCGPICSLMVEVYVARNMNDLSSLNSWNKELTVTAPSIAYNLELEEFVHIIIVTDEILVIQLEERDVVFFDVATGKLLGLYSVPFHATAIPYVPSLVALRHRPLLSFLLLNYSIACRWLLHVVLYRIVILNTIFVLIVTYILLYRIVKFVVT
ncbi:uncharacterized protein [Nicotiana sylvestris]|uniref:uncharacterized protein isoform X2 n=1 Tax=Nicotiana sylvestris TaxID=4096 RepID=UPI00388CA3CA